MKRITLTLCSAILLLSACSNKKKVENTTDKDTTSAASTTTTDKKEETMPMTMPDSATMMKNMQAYATPGEVHKMLAKSAGTWNTEGTYWEKPGAPGTKFNGTEVTKMIMGGRYQVSNFSGKMMGMDFEGMSTVAYDNMKKVFISTWIDNGGTGLMTLEGPWDEATKSITFKGKEVNPELMKEVDTRQVFTMVDDNTNKMEMYLPGPDGKEMKVMEIKYTRKK